MDNRDKEKNIVDENLKKALKDIEKKFGQGAIMNLGDQTHVNVETFSTGSYLLDQALGAGGYPVGRIIEIYGPESSGKTTLALHAIAEVQKIGGKVAYIDAEHAIDPAYAKALGVNLNEFYLAQPSSGEEALEIADELIKSQVFSLIVVDSVAALVPKQELEGSMDEAQMGLQARMMSKALRKITGSLNQYRCTIIFINQLREKIGVMFGNPETTPGGRALKYSATVRIDIRKGEPIKVANETVGNEVNIKVVKNKVAAPYKVAKVELVYGKGISKLSEILDLAVQYGFINKLGSWYEYNGEKIGQGKENAKLFLTEHQDIYEELSSKIESKLKGND